VPSRTRRRATPSGTAAKIPSRKHILAEIKRTAAENGGRVLGVDQLIAAGSESGAMIGYGSHQSESLGEVAT
jgi:hypothetical protein